MKTKTITVYSFDELSDEAKKKAIENFYDINVDDEYWSEFIIEDAKELGLLMGIDIDKIYFSGFASQGDGACFEGSYSYNKGSVKAVKEHAPNDATVLTIAERLQGIQKKHFYKLTANVKQSGHYMHEMCTAIEVYKDGNYLYSKSEEEAEEEIKDTLRDYMRWIYKRLEEEYYYQTKEEAITESIKANEYEFDEDGNML